ncbi:kinase-like protein [Gigaspora margarita]|uniref:Kinase-like protein n=1 Tax=Gigaspora margarita TaxID=4874 RepID=A0A8H3X7D8_GIGMA|nr:kinase-like protein [Gigaspora margarita]
MTWNDKLYLAKQISSAINVRVLLWEISNGAVPFESESPFGYDCLIAIIHGKRETDAIGTPQEYSLIYEDCWSHDSNKRPSIQSFFNTVFNQLAYQDYNFSMICYFHEHGILMSTIIKLFGRITIIYWTHKNSVEFICRYNKTYQYGL